jgi:hypothetical protein
VRTVTEESSGKPVAGPSARGPAGQPLRVLTTIEDEHRMYREVIVQGLRSARPQFRVSTDGPHEFDGEPVRLDPEAVVNAGSPTPVPDRRLCRIQLSVDPGLPTKMWVGQRSDHLSLT